MNSNTVTILVLVSLMLVMHSIAFQCRSDSGQAVDWWIAFKYPNPDGRVYSYTDSATSGNTIKRSSRLMQTGSASALNYTLSQIYGKTTNSLSFVLFSDEPYHTAKLNESLVDNNNNNNNNNDDDSSASSGDDEYTSFARREIQAAQKAHAKGVIAFDNTGDGFWLMHSVPRFPISPLESNVFQYMDDSQVKFAQSFLCISYNGWNSFNSIGIQMQFYRPQFYGSQISTTGQSSAPELWNAVDFGKYVNRASWNIENLRSKAGMAVKSFAKTGYYGNGWDMWQELIAPQLGTSLYVETWRQGSGNPLPSNCTTRYVVENVEYVQFDSVKWKYTADHSKWGTAIPTSQKWVCVSGINRMASQGNRGGGAMCFENVGVHKSLELAIVGVSACPKK